ncbi:MAG: YkgJ family cysteine cluster protein [Candidatus Gastranaerophilaceae bacterium]
MLKKYEKFIKEFDKKIRKYFEVQSEHICCKEGCAGCCEIGDYPFSQLEMMYLMTGFKKLSLEKQKIIKQNMQNIKKNRFSEHFFYQCPFLIDKKCSVYKYRGITCRTFGLAYLIDKKNKQVKLPECSKEGLNFCKVYNGKEFSIEPIKENLDLPSVIKSKLAKNNKLEFGEIRSLVNWFPD